MSTYLPLTLRLLIWLVCSSFVVGLAYQLQRLVRTDRKSLNAMSFVFLLIFVTTLFVVLAGLMGILSPIPLLLISLAGILVMLLLPGSRKAFAFLPEETREYASAVGYWWKDLPVWLRWLTGLGLVASALRFGFLIWALPPFVWDSLTYHLTNVAHWTQTGSIELFETSMARIYTPGNFEALAAWFTVFLHHDAVIEAAGLPAYLLAILAVYAGIRGLGITRAAAWVGAMAYASTPALLLATTGTKNDPHVAAYFLSALAIILNFANRRRSGAAHNPAGQLILLALILLIAAGTKAYIAHLIPGLAIIAWFAAKRTGERGHWRRVLRIALSQLRKERALRIVGGAILVLGIFMGSFWNVRNWVLTGNPFYPYGVEIEGQQVLDGADRKAELSSDRLFRNLESLVYKFGDQRARISPDLTDTTGWGWFAYSLGLAALIWAVFSRSDFRILALGFGASLLLLFMSTRPSPWNMRYAIWFPALFSYAFAAFVDKVLSTYTFPARAILALLVTSLILNFTSVLNYGRIDIADFERMLSLPVLDRNAASLRINMPGEYENALAIVPGDAVLGYNTHSNGFIYPLYRANLSQSITYVPVSLDGTCDEVAQAMEERGTRYLFVAPEHSNDRVIAYLRNCGDTDTILRERSRGLYVIKREP